MKECIVCGKLSIQLFNIFTIYGTINHTVFDDITEIFGYKVKKMFDSADCVCHMCMNMLDNVAKLKRHIWSLITHTTLKPGTLGKIWNVFASLQLEDGGLDEDTVESCSKPNGNENAAFTSRVPTPSLLQLKYTEDYDCDRERKIAQEHYQKKANGEHSAENLEVEEIFSRRRNARRTPSRERSRSVSASSVSTTRSTRSRKTSSRNKGVQYDDQGRLIRKRTRSVSRAQEAELEQSNFTCQIGDCPVYFNDFDVFNQHMIEDHNSLAVFFCNECGKRYISSKLLQKHNAVHDTMPFFCPMCGEEVGNRSSLQSHLAEHLVYSVGCKHCDKSFLSGSIRDAHTRREHQCKRQRFPVSGKLMMEIFDYEKSSVAGTDVDEEVMSDDFEIHYMCYSGIRAESEDLDVTIENLRAQNVDFYSEADLEGVVEDECS